MNPAAPSYPASASHAECGTEEVTGEIRIETQGLMFEHGTGGVGLPFRRLRIARDDDGRIRFTDPEQPDWEVFTATDRILGHHVFKQRNDLRSQVRDLRRRQEGRRMVRLTGIFLVSFAAVALFFSVASTLVVNFLIARIPVSWEAGLGRAALEGLEDQLKAVEDPVRLARLGEVSDQLARGLPKHDYRFEFRLVDAPWPNAFALPGGTILVTTGLFETAQTPEEVAGVLAHEMAHVLRRHGLRKIITSAGPYYVMRLFLSDRHAFLAAVGEGSSLLVQQSFSRDYEREADRTAWGYLVTARIDPRGLSSFLRKTSDALARMHGGPSIDDLTPRVLRSHPPDEERLQYLEDLWNRSKVKSDFVNLPPFSDAKRP